MSKAQNVVRVINGPFAGAEMSIPKKSPEQRRRMRNGLAVRHAFMDPRPKRRPSSFEEA